MSDLFNRDGAGQDERYLPALEENYVNVDEFSLHDLLAMGVEIAELLHYFNLENRIEGDWSPFLSSDVSVMIARIGFVDLDRVESEFIARFNFDSENKIDHYFNLADLILKLARRIDYWHSRLSRSDDPTGNRIQSKIRGIIDYQLQEMLHSLGAFLVKCGYRAEKEKELNFADFSSVWGIEVAEDGQYDFPQSKLEDLSGKLPGSLFLKSVFYVFMSTVVFLKKFTLDLFAESLENQEHNAASTLFIAFAHLYMKMRDSIDGFTQRHFDFYYSDILKIKGRSFKPDSAYLVFEPLPEGKTTVIDKGAGFTAGKDENGNDLIYTADGGLVVDSSRLEEAYTLTLEKRDRISPEMELGAVSHVKLNKLVFPENPDGAGKTRPLFGAARDAARFNPFPDAMMGFALSSGTLLLKEGIRNITISIHFKIIPGQESESLFANLKKYQAAKGIEPIEIYHKIFNSCFNLYLTAENGWFRIRNYFPGITFDENETLASPLVLKMRLGPQDPPITSYRPDIHGEGFQTDLPMIKFILNPDAYMHPYSILRLLDIQSIKIEVDVSDVKNIQVYNQLGRLDPGSTFSPFGPTPTLGSFFIVGAYEAARKKITSCRVDVEWADLPTEKGGFREYYRGYEQPYDDELFEARISVLAGGQWRPARKRDQEKIQLFPRDPETRGQGVSKRLSAMIAGPGLAYYNDLNPEIVEENFNYDLSAAEGFFKFTLTGPGYAFGFREYSKTLSKTLMYNMMFKKKPKPLPNPPYIPAISRISIHYTAESLITLEKKPRERREPFMEKIYHLHPLGAEVIHPLKKFVTSLLIPRFEHAGNLYLGLSIPGKTRSVTLFFHLRKDSFHGVDAQSPRITWSHLTGNTWRPFRNTAIQSDTTNGFLTSGIVSLRIPRGVSLDHSIMPENLFWIRISADKNLDAFCTVRAIRPHAIKATYRGVEEGSAPRARMKLPSGAIKTAEPAITGLGEIHQAAETFGGRPPEDRRALRTRINERLRHKNRAVSPWDYERLVLDEFPDLYRVKCFSSMSSTKGKPPDYIAPGHILIAVLPFVDSSAVVDNTRPAVESFLLKQVRDFVDGLSSSFAWIEVKNPVYETIQIRCAVKFKQGMNDGYYLTLLDNDISAYMSPWRSGGYSACFGWRVLSHEIESFIKNLDYVDFATDFSMLHITHDENENAYTLSDTVRPPGEGGAPLPAAPSEPPGSRAGGARPPAPGAARIMEITPKYPWSIAIPAEQHFIELVDRRIHIAAEPTGVDELEIGETFIIPGK
ncbi:MAG: hypothetical protein GY859_02025 [Desulfobacterales bacterium]|nr:hypothetical protein [Desulfobacterales bacterium]